MAKSKKNNQKSTHPIHNSIQIWYEGNKDYQAEIALDINIWRMNNFEKSVLMDFGLKIEDASIVKTIFMYFPFEFDNTNITDLGKTFLDQQILKGIFNENYVISANTKNPKNILVKDDNTNDVKFSIYKFEDSDFSVTNGFGGTILSFEVKIPPQTKSRYYRFRISCKEYPPFIEHYQPKNTFFESAFVETELLDFRINEKRNQDPSLIEAIVEKLRFKLLNVNFFVMTSVEDEVISDGINLIYKRQLEMGDFWNKYLEMPYDKMSVYKCNNVKTGSNGIEDFICFAKINYRKSNISTIIKYLLVLFIITIAFSICANVISNFIWHWIELIDWRIG